MANVINYIFNISGNFASNIGIMVNHTEQLSQSLENATGFIEKLGKKAMGFAAIADVAQNMNEAFSGIIEAGASAELQLMNLKTLFGGNAEAAEAMYERISEYGKVTPYDKAGLLEAQRTMMSFGMSGEAAFSTLQQIGDIAMGDSQKLQSLALAFAQMSSTGKLTGQDLMQMINAGFNPLNEISKVTGKSVGTLKEEMSKGAISADMVSEAFRMATSEGGLFYGAIEAASETTAGRMASIRDTIEEIKVSLFNALGDFGLWISTISEVMVPLSQVMPLLTGVFGLMSKIKGLNWAGMWGRIRGALAIMVGTMSTGKNISLGFAGNIGRATIALLQFGTIGIFNALKGLGALILSFVTGGTASENSETNTEYKKGHDICFSLKVAPIEKLGQPLLREPQDLELKPPMKQLKLESLNNISELKQEEYRKRSIRLTTDELPQENITFQTRENKGEELIYIYNLREEVESIIEELLI